MTFFVHMDGQRWVIESRGFVATGGCGVVARAKCDGKPDIVVKILREDRHASAENELRFLRALSASPPGCSNLLAALAADVMLIESEDSGGKSCCTCSAGADFGIGNVEIGAARNFEDRAKQDAPGNDGQTSRFGEEDECVSDDAECHRICPESLAGLRCFAFPRAQMCLFDAVARGCDFVDADTVALGVARGLSHMLDLNFVHLDVKTENVLIRSIPCNCLSVQDVVLCDYGGTILLPVLAPASGEAVCKAGHDGRGKLGSLTPGSSPLEAFDGRVSRKSDVFSLGILFHNVLSNLYLFDCYGSQREYRECVRELNVSAEAFHGLCPRDCRLILECVRENCTERPSMAFLVEEFERRLSSPSQNGPSQNERNADGK